MKTKELNPIFFENSFELRKWFEKNHEKEFELWVGYYKKNSGKPSITWSESVDEALCFGWIDGIRKSIDNIRYTIRFTPRRPKSIWSKININKVKALKNLGLMYPSGLAIYAKREKENSGVYSFEKVSVNLDDDFEKTFRKNTIAWSFFKSQAPSYQKPAINWVMGAKHEITRLKRLKTLISDSEAGLKIKELRPIVKK